MREPTLEIDPIRRVAIANWADIEPTIDLCRTLLDRLLADPAFARHFGILGDHRRLRTPPTQEFVLAFVDFLEESQRSGRFTGRVASVISPRELEVYGMASMTEILADLANLNANYRAFVDFDEAVAWVSGHEPISRRLAP